MAKAQKKNTKAKQNKAPKLDELSHVGERLKAVRETNKLDLNTVAEELMIRRFYLQAIEDGNFKELPAPVYATGFIKNYAEFLGFDVDSAVAEFKREAYGAKRQSSPELVFPDPMTTSMIPTNAAIFAGAGFIALVVVIGLIFALPDDDAVRVEIPEAPVVASEKVEEIQQITPEVEIDTTVSETVSSQPENGLLILPETAEKPTTQEAVTDADTTVAVIQEEKDSRVTIKAVQTSWIEVADGDGNIVLSRILKSGETFDVPDQAGMQMITGNAGGVRVILDGSELPKLGSVGDVRRNLSLNPDDLKKTFNLN